MQATRLVPAQNSVLEQMAESSGDMSSIDWLDLTEGRELKWSVRTLRMSIHLLSKSVDAWEADESDNI